MADPTEYVCSYLRTREDSSVTVFSLQNTGIMYKDMKGGNTECAALSEAFPIGCYLQIQVAFRIYKLLNH